jgi:hypothetical protein
VQGCTRRLSEAGKAVQKSTAFLPSRLKRGDSGEMDRTPVTGEDARFTFIHGLVFSVTVH